MKKIRENPFSKLSFSQFEFNLEALSKISLPEFSGTTFRGAFGYSLKSVACLEPKKDCKSCIHSDICVYAYVFETPLPKNSKIMRKYPNVPHPFILDPPEKSKRLYKKGENIKFGLTLIGKAIPFLPYFIHSFEFLGKRGLGKKDKGKFRIKGIMQGKRKIYKDGVLWTNYKIETASKFWKNIQDVNRIAITFITPVRIIFKGREAKDLEFHILFRSLLRRLSLLLYFHAGEEPDVDFKKMIKESENIKCVDKKLRKIRIERYSTRQKQKIPIQGISGKIVYEGNITQFLPYLRLGEILHLGKNTSFGMGKYKIEIL